MAPSTADGASLGWVLSEFPDYPIEVQLEAAVQLPGEEGVAGVDPVEAAAINVVT